MREQPCKPLPAAVFEAGVYCCVLTVVAGAPGIPDSVRRVQGAQFVQDLVELTEGLQGAGIELAGASTYGSLMVDIVGMFLLLTWSHTW